MDFWYDQDTEFVQRLVEFFHLGEYWYVYLAALIIVIASTEALTRSKRGSKKVTKVKKSSNFWPAAGLVAIVFLIIVGTLEIAGVGLTAKVKAPSLPSAVTQTVEEAEARLHQRSENRQPPAQQRKRQPDEQAANVEADEDQDEVQVPVWHDGLALLLALVAGGLSWRKRRWAMGCFGAGGIAVLNGLFRDNLAGASWQAPDFFKIALVALICVWVYWRLGQAQKNGQWLATIDPKTREVNNRYKVLLFEKQQIPFVIFHLLLILGIVFCDTMFRTNLWLTALVCVLWALISIFAVRRVEDERLRFWAQIALGGMMLLIMLSFWGILLLLPMVGFYLLSTFIKLEPAQKITWEWMGRDAYNPRYYFWQREDGEDTTYRGELLVIGDYKRCFRKGTHSNLRFSVWLPDNFLRVYFFPEEVLEIDSFVCDPFSTISVPYPRSNDLDVYDVADLADVLKFEPEVTVSINVSVWKYMHVGLYLPMADEDRRDEINFVKRKIIQPAVARFLGRMTMAQATVLKLLRSNARFLIDGEELTFAEYLGRELRKYGWDLRGAEVGDCNPPKAILEAAEAVKKAEQLIEAAQNEAQQIAATAKGEGFKLLNTLQPLAEALKTDPSLAVVMDYYRSLQLYGGSNKLFAMLPNQGQELMGSLAAVIKAFGGTVPPPPPAPPSTPPAPPTS
jgi:hypothetical protein